MGKSFISMFDVIGPVMVGPSSSHTSGAATIAWMARQIFDGTPNRVKFTLYGSFAQTYKGHGTDRALIGGILGYRSDDVRIREAYEHAEEAGIRVKLTADKETKMPHPNTVDIVLGSEDGHSLLIRGESIGGGRVKITRLNEIKVDFTGEYSTLIVGHRDVTGTVAYIMKCLANHEVNMASMRSFRESKGGSAFTVIETDDYIPDELVAEVESYYSINAVELIQL